MIVRGCVGRGVRYIEAMLRADDTVGTLRRVHREIMNLAVFHDDPRLESIAGWIEFHAERYESMAYLVDLNVTCDERGCRSRAVVELKDWLNESRGRFCRKCGKRKLAERDAFEKENPHHR